MPYTLPALDRIRRYDSADPYGDQPDQPDPSVFNGAPPSMPPPTPPGMVVQPQQGPPPPQGAPPQLPPQPPPQQQQASPQPPLLAIKSGVTPAPPPPQQQAPAGLTPSMQALSQMQRPARPKNNLFQTIGQTMLGLNPRIGPAGAQAIMHPNYTQQMAGYQGQEQDLEQRAKLEETDVRNQAYLAWKRAQDANYEAVNDTRQDQLALRQQQAKWDNFARQIKGRENLGQYQDSTAAVPPGYEPIPVPRDPNNPAAPNQVFIAPSGLHQVTPGMEKYFPERKVGDIIPLPEWNAGKAQYLKDIGQEAKPQKELAKDDKYIAIIAKQQAGQALTPEEQAYAKAYKQYTNETKVQPGVTRMEVLNQGRPIQVLGDNGEIRYDTAGNAMRTNALAPGNIPGSTRATRIFAQTVTQQIPTLQQEVAELKDQLGPAAGRWNDLWVNKTGLNDPAFAALDQDLKLYASAIVRVHFGLKGGEDVRKGLEKNFSEAQSPEDLQARIAHADNWVQGYATMGNKRGGGKPQQPQQGGWAATATGRNGHKIGTRDGRTWLDVQTGQPVQ